MKKLALNTFSFADVGATLQDKKKDTSQNLHNFNIEGATGPRNLKNTIETQISWRK